MKVGKHFIKLILCLLPFLGLELASCTSGAMSHRLFYPPQDSVERLISGKSIQEEVDSLALPVINSGEAAGVSIGILYPDGQMNFYGYGRATDSKKSMAPSGDTIFEIGSLSKLFVLSIYSSMLKEGIISENTTVREIFPESVILSDDIASVTLNELATNTAGFPRELWSFSQLFSFMNYLFTGENIYSYMNKEWLYDFLQKVELPPREKRTYIYSNLGISLLSLLLEIRSGKPFYRLAEERIFKPLGMENTVYKITDAQRKRLATGHAGDQPFFMLRGSSVEDWDMGELMYPTGACYSTVKDLLIFSRANLGITQTSLSPVFADMQKVRIETPTEKFGLGWSIDYCGFNNIKIIYKHGMVSGYSAYIGFNPESNTAVVTLYNSFNWNEKIAHNLLIRLSSYVIKTGSQKKNIARKLADMGLIPVAE